MLQVVGQVAARQLDGAAIGTGDHVESAGGEVALRETQQSRVRRPTHVRVHHGHWARMLLESTLGMGEGGSKR